MRSAWANVVRLWNRAIWFNIVFALMWSWWAFENASFGKRGFAAFFIVASTIHVGLALYGMKQLREARRALAEDMTGSNAE